MTELSRNWDAQSSLFTWAGPWWSVAAGGTEAAAEPVVSERFVSLERREGMVVVVLLLLLGGREGRTVGRACRIGARCVLFRRHWTLDARCKVEVQD